MASSERTKNQNKENKNREKALTYIKYKDHVLFRNSNSSKIKPSTRMTIGWVAFENSDCICICSDLPTQPLPRERAVESGYVILKAAVLEKHEVDLGKQFKPSTAGYSGRN